MVKHTPGPWSLPHFADDAVECNCVYVLSEGYFGSICDIGVDNGKCVSKGGNDDPPLEEAKANARLISAAPDLLVALKDLVAEYDGAVLPPKVSAARAAISKAEEQPPWK
jgi:hypothetical protein